jgi:hypothetical protein
MQRIRLFASSVFFVAFLAFQAIYPSLIWFDPSRNGFSWTMYSGASPRPSITVVFDDGSSRSIVDPLYSRNPPRVLGASVDLWRFLPPHLCARLNGAREVRTENQRLGRREVTRCP